MEQGEGQHHEIGTEGNEKKRPHSRVEPGLAQARGQALAFFPELGEGHSMPRGGDVKRQTLGALAGDAIQRQRDVVVGDRHGA